MMGSVRCPSCGRENAVETVRLYRMCSGCGMAMEVPTAEAQVAPPQAAYHGGQAPPTVTAPPSGPPPPYASPPYGAPAGYQYPYPYPYPPQYPPMYPAPYPYPYPYAMGPPPSNHPGVYEKPEEPRRLDLGALVSVLFRPRDAFRDLYGHTDSRMGLMVVVILTIIEGLISLTLSLTVLSEAESTGFSLYGSLAGGIAVVTFGAGIVTSLAMFIGVCYFAHALLKSSPTTLRPNLDKTIGLLGYAAMPGLVMGVLNVVVVGSMSAALADPGDTNITAAVGYVILTLVLALVGLIWSLWVQGHAVSVANDAPWGKSALIVFVASILVGIIVFVIAMLIVAIFGLATFQGV